MLIRRASVLLVIREDKKMRYWYAVQKNSEDNDWGTGSYDYDKAVEMAHTYSCEIIAVIDEESGNEPMCVDEIFVNEL